MPQYVDCIPECLSEGILYICERYHTAAHQCCCGCGEEVITPLTPADWSIRKEGDYVTLHPSIGNWSMACRSHYWIRKNQVVWAKALSQWEIDQVRARDRADKEEYTEEVNRRKEQQAEPSSVLHNLWLAVLRWWNS